MPAEREAVRVYAHNFLSAGDYSFTHRDRLHTASQFQRVFNQAKRSSSDIFTILFRENTVGYPRLGIVIAKRNVKHSADRNLIKRIIRESFRLHKTQLPANDYVVILKHPVNNLSREKIREQLIHYWNSNATS